MLSIPAFSESTSSTPAHGEGSNAVPHRGEKNTHVGELSDHWNSPQVKPTLSFQMIDHLEEIQKNFLDSF